LARLPLPPRLAHMLLAASPEETWLAAGLAVLLTERGLGGSDIDLRHRLAAFDTDRSRRANDARRMAAAWQRSAGGSGQAGNGARAGAVLAQAYPDRIAEARPGRPGEFRLANGRGAMLDPTDALAGEAYLVVAELVGDATRARVAAAAPITAAEIEADFAAAIAVTDEVRFDPSTGSVRGRRLRRLGALVLQEMPLARPDPAAVSAALGEGIRTLGLDALPWTDELSRWRERVAFMRRLDGEDWPDVGTSALVATLDRWLLPYLAGKRAVHEIGTADLGAALHGLLPHALHRRLDKAAPAAWLAPSGRAHAIDYAAAGGPTVAVRVQELFGLGEHPRIAEGREPLTLALLSPAQRPVQVTRDLPGFWRGSYQAVRAEMRGRYPRHPWPDDPLRAPPTTRAKPRG
jgi:ATP-dependent helicase HrpB